MTAEQYHALTVRTRGWLAHDTLAALGKSTKEARELTDEEISLIDGLALPIFGECYELLKFRSVQ